MKYFVAIILNKLLSVISVFKKKNLNSLDLFLL